MTIEDLVFVDLTGWHYADYPSFLSFYKTGYQGIYGSDIYLENDSQDGQIVALQAQAGYDCARVGASAYNSFSPVTAQGVGLSRQVKINGLRRQVPTYSTVDIDLGGTVGTTITNGVVEDVLNQKWSVPTTTIPSDGTITVTATSQALGAVQAASNTVTKISTPTQGWQTVNNPNPASPGTAVETDAELRVRQSQSTANPSLTVLEGTYGAVANLTGVTHTRTYENDTGSTDINGLPAHSFTVVVKGGDSTAIAQAIQVHKTPGTSTVGNTSVLVYDSKGVPILISFTRPTDVTITVVINLTASAGYSTGFNDAIKQAVADVINAFDIGNDVLITKLYAPGYLNGAVQGTTYDITTIEIGKNLDPPANANIDIDFDELPMCDPTMDIQIVVT